MVAGERRCSDTDAFFQPLIAEVGAPFPGRNCYVNAEIVRTQTQRLGPVKQIGRR